MEFKAELEKRQNEVEIILHHYLPAEKGLQKKLIQAMNYSFLAGGKRLRPMLMLETFRLFGGQEEPVYPFMASIEMIHTYSLIHDDLPAMDNDDYRRGKKTNHRVFGEDMAILAGDGLLNLAFETAADAAVRSQSLPAIRALSWLASCSGIYGMVGGQCVDVETEGQAIEKDTLDFINDLKTGALLRGAMGTGAILGGASEEEFSAITEAASAIGRAFQIRDDILDVAGCQETLGKSTGSDKRNQKTTYVTLRGLKQSEQDVEDLTEKALGILAALPYENPFLTELIKNLARRKK